MAFSVSVGMREQARLVRWLNGQFGGMLSLVASDELLREIEACARSRGYTVADVTLRHDRGEVRIRVGGVVRDGATPGAFDAADRWLDDGGAAVQDGRQ